MESEGSSIMSDFKKQMDFSENLASLRMIEVIEWIVDKKLQEQNYPEFLVGKVSAVNGSLVDVLLPDCTAPIPDLKNKTGLTLNINDEVYILLIKGSLNNAVVLIKK